MEWINLAFLYGSAAEKSADWTQKVQELKEQKPKNTRAYRKMIKDLDRGHRTVKKETVDEWTQSGQLDLAPKLISDLRPLVYKRLKKVNPKEKELTNLPIYSQEGILAEIYFDPQASYYQEYLLQEAYYAPCAVLNDKEEWIDPIVLDFLPVEADLLATEKVVLGAQIQRILPSQFLLDPDITRLFVELEYKEKEPSESLIARIDGKKYLLQDSSHGKSPLFFKSGSVLGSQLKLSQLERTWEPGDCDGENEWTAENPSFGLLGLKTLESVVPTA